MNTVLNKMRGINGLWQISNGSNGYLIVKGGKSLLIDCPDYRMNEIFNEARLPYPEYILHTQVQEEFCREWSAFPDIRVIIPKVCTEIALKTRQYFSDCDTIWLSSEPWDINRGAEKYGHGGCITARPPMNPLKVAGGLDSGEIFAWNGLKFEFVALPGSGKYSHGIYWHETNVVFTGNLIRSGGYLCNLYDLERCYGLPAGYAELKNSLNKILSINPDFLLPGTGPAISKPCADCESLMERIKWVEDPPSYKKDEEYSPVNYTPIHEFGRYREIVPGLFQNNNFGNIVLFIDHRGNGLIVDPDSCVWNSWDENIRDMEADLAFFEKEAGLKRIEFALLTHYHGDHVRFCNLLRARYGTKILAAPEVSALLERPGDFPYPVRLPWYALPFDRIDVDGIIMYNQPLKWHDINVVPIHTPGHCYAHSGFIIPWKGMLTVCTGDTLIYGAGPIKVELPVIYNDTSWPDRGHIVTFERLSAIRADLVLGGHSHSFFDSNGIVISHFLNTARESLEAAAGMLHDGNTLRAMTPPGYDCYRSMLGGK